MPYFHISTGLRGGYLADNSYIIRATTRRELKQAIAYEAHDYRDAGFVGASQRAIAWLANVAWKEAKKPRPAYLPYCMELAPPHARDNYCNGIFVTTSNRAEYLAQETE